MLILKHPRCKRGWTARKKEVTNGLLFCFFMLVARSQLAFPLVIALSAIRKQVGFLSACHWFAYLPYF